MKKETLEFLETHQSETPSKWREEAEWRRDNWSWLRHSQKIAVKVLLQMKQEVPDICTHVWTVVSCDGCLE